MTWQQLAGILALGVTLSGCGEEDDAKRYGAFEAMGTCELPNPCGDVSVYDDAAVSCAMSTLLAAAPARLSVESSFTGDERLLWDAFLLGDGTALVAYREVFNGADQNWDDPLDYGWDELVRCDLTDAGFYAACPSGDPSDACRDPNQWWTGCVAAEPTCP